MTTTATNQSAATGPTPIRRPVPVASVQGTLALELTPCIDRPEAPHLRAVTGADLTTIAAEQRARLDRWVRRYLQVAVEIVAGDRPASQVLRHTDADVFADLTRRAELVARAGGHAPGGGRASMAVRPTVLGCRTSLVRDDAVETCVHVRYGDRSRAVAARFEVLRERWVCVALEFA
jgi:hypothetical protein